MNEKDLDRLEKMIREIIETLEEDGPEGEPEALSTINQRSPFQSLISCLEMELASVHMDSSYNAQEHESSEKPDGEKVLNEEPVSKILDIAAPVTTKTTQIDHVSNTHIRSPSSANSEAESDINRGVQTKTLLATFALFTALIAGVLFLGQRNHPTDFSKTYQKFPDVKKVGEQRNSHEVNAPSKDEQNANSIYLMGKKELSRHNLSAAREHFRIAVSIDPSNEIYMKAYRQVDEILRSIKATLETPESKN